MITSDADRAAAIRVTRRLLGAYVLLTVLLFLPAFLRVMGAVFLPGIVQSWLGVGCLVGMVVTLVLWFLRLSALGMWHPGSGPRFAVLPALFDGRFVPTGGEPTSATTPSLSSTSPLGLLAADVARVTGEVEARGDLPLADLVRAALREAEGLTSALVLYERLAGPEALARARAAVGAFEAHVVALGRERDDAGWTERFTADLTELRAAGDALRTRPG